MRYEEFIERVRRYGQADSLRDAEKATEASLATLGERLSGTEIAELGAQLPKEIKRFLIEQTDLDRFSLEEFYNRVSSRADIGHHEAIKMSRAVMAVLKEAVTTGLLRQILAGLPAEFGELFGQQPLSPLSPTEI